MFYAVILLYFYCIKNCGYFESRLSFWLCTDSFITLNIMGLMLKIESLKD